MLLIKRKLVSFCVRGSFESSLGKHLVSRNNPIIPVIMNKMWLKYTCLPYHFGRARFSALEQSSSSQLNCSFISALLILLVFINFSTLFLWHIARCANENVLKCKHAAGANTAIWHRDKQTFAVEIKTSWQSQAMLYVFHLEMEIN